MKIDHFVQVTLAAGIISALILGAGLGAFFHAKYDVAVREQLLIETSRLGYNWSMAGKPWSELSNALHQICQTNR